MTTDTYKIFTSRNNGAGGDVSSMCSSSEMSCVGELPTIRPKTFDNRKMVATFFNRSALKTSKTGSSSSTKRKQRQMMPTNQINSASGGHVINGESSSSDGGGIRPMANEGAGNDENMPTNQIKAKAVTSLNATNHNKTVQQHIKAAKRNACNISVMRQTLRANNKALAVALEMAKQEIKELKDDNLLLKSLNQELRAQLNRYQDYVDSYELRFSCVKMRLDEMVGEFNELFDDVKMTHAAATNNDGDNDILSNNNNNSLSRRLERSLRATFDNPPSVEIHVQVEEPQQQTQTDKRRSVRRRAGSFSDLFTPIAVFRRARDQRRIESPEVDDAASSRHPIGRIDGGGGNQSDESKLAAGGDVKKSNHDDVIEDDDDDRRRTGQALRRSKRKTLLIDYKETKPDRKHRHGDRNVRRKKSLAVEDQ